MNELAFTMKNIASEGRNVYFLLELEGFTGVFRIWYEDKARSNARFPDRRAINIYFEVEHTWEYFKKHEGCFYPSHEVKHMTDAMLFAERRMQYLLQEYFRRFDT